jgi:hypothetical protein
MPLRPWNRGLPPGPKNPGPWGVTLQTSRPLEKAPLSWEKKSPMVAGNVSGTLCIINN